MELPPASHPRNLHFSDDALGWFNGTSGRRSAPIAIMIAFGHSLLSMSGFETLAQVYREIAYPKMKNLKIHRQHRVHLRRLLHRHITLFAVMIIPGRRARTVRR